MKMVLSQNESLSNSDLKTMDYKHPYKLQTACLCFTIMSEKNIHVVGSWVYYSYQHITVDELQFKKKRLQPSQLS